MLMALVVLPSIKMAFALLAVTEIVRVMYMVELSSV